MTFRTTFRDTRSSRQIALIDLPCPKNPRRIFAIVSTISIPTSAPIIMEASVDPQPPGSRLDADHPENGVLIPRRNTLLGVDEGEALCKDRNAYSISVLVEPDGTTITSLTCRELLATSKRLLHRAGSRSRAVGCRIK